MPRRCSIAAHLSPAWKWRSKFQAKYPLRRSEKRFQWCFVRNSSRVPPKREPRPAGQQAGFAEKISKHTFVCVTETVLILVNRIRERRRSTGIVHREEGDEFIVKVVFCVLVCPVEPAPNLAGSLA
jgi:hypothetical protein